jgi:hypothetical protein
VRRDLFALLLVLGFALCAPSTLAVAADTETSQKNRRKPLQRCDQLKGDAEVECLQKARERVVEAREKRERGESAETEKSEGKK